MNRRNIRSFRSWALTGVAMAAIAGPAYAEDARRFEIPQQSLIAALEAFGKQGDKEILFSRSAAEGRATSGVVGEYEPAQALSMLLDGSGLRYRQVNANTYVVEAADPQGGSAAGGGAEVEALIVTAQKREEDIQDVPIAISAFTQEDLERSQIAGGPDLITQVPNMTFTKTNFSSYSIQLRGIGTQAISATTDPGVAVAFNNTPFIQNRFFEQEFYDLQRVEVLRGPQGTLYGRNATAGVVNIISQKPKFAYEAKLSGDLSNYTTTRVEGMINIPLVEDAVALRLAGAWTKRDGYSTNEITGNPIDGRDLWSTRLSLRVSPSSAIDMNLIWEHFEENDDRLRSGKQLCKKHVTPPEGFSNFFAADHGQGGFPAFNVGCVRNSLYDPDSFQTPHGLAVPYYYPLGFIGLPTTSQDPYASQVQSRDLRVIESTVDPIYKATADLGELQISWDVNDNLTLASETAYAVDFVYSLQDFNRFNTKPGAWAVTPGGLAEGSIDENGVFCDPQIGCSDRLVAIDVSTAKSTQFNQEFRLSSNFDGPFNFSLGANFTRFDLEAKYYVFINSLTLSRVGDRFGSFEGEIITWEPGVSDNSQCATNGVLTGNPAGETGYLCVYIEPNSIANIEDQGHNYFLSKNPYKLISYAVFGEAYYNVTDALKVTAGLRWTVDRKEAPRIPSWTLAGDSRGYPVLEVTNQEWREPTGRLTVDWKPDLSFTDETLLYASYAHGYKAGGANPPPMMLIATGRFGGTPASLTRPKTFDPEFVDAFELGSKNTLADGQVTLNLAAFYYDYKDYQISEIVDRSAFNRNFDATIWGLELEADWRPLENLKLGIKGGYENAVIADGEAAIDLMDRTAGKEGWVVVRPFPTSASSCVLPTYVYLRPDGSMIDIGSPSGGGAGGCELAYLSGVDPQTEAPYVANPTVSTPGLRPPYAGYRGFNPFDESQGHNFGEGFVKDLSGNYLPNAPEFTATLTVDYTVPLPGDWLATLHTDLYWQAESWWRVFDDHEFNKLDEYFTANLAAIFTNEDAGWRVMAYVKNVFDRDSITGAFLNSDDTGLTTNVFLTEPRLYGLRVTKEWTGGPLLGNFGERRDGPYPFTIELGGQVQRHEAPNAPIEPSFMDEFSDAINPLADQQDDLDWGDGREVKLTFRPSDTWKVALGAQFGKTNAGMPWSERREEGDRTCETALSDCQNDPGPDYIIRYNYTISTTADREEHMIVDFTLGRDFGFGALDESAVTAGLRYAELESTTAAHIFGPTNWNLPVDENSLFEFAPATHDRFVATTDADREFKGVGPVLSWEASKALLGNRQAGVLGLDWAVTGGVLFGKRKTQISGEEIAEYFSDPAKYENNIPNADLAGFPDVTTALPPVDFQREEDVTIPVYGASLGLSYQVDRFSIGAGYRWERYQDAIDGGYDEAQEEDRTIDGPYFKASVGFGG